MRDGIILRADLYLPNNNECFPLLLQRTPYSKTGNTALKLFKPEEAVEAGYAVLIQDTRGRFTSDGDFHPYINEAQDGYDTVEWAAAQEWCNGKVGMYGMSYMASTSLLAASLHPPHLLTLAPGMTGASHYHGWVYQGGALNLISRLAWTLLMIRNEAERKKIDFPPIIAMILSEINNMSLHAGDAKKLSVIIDGLKVHLNKLIDVFPLENIAIPEGLGEYFKCWLDHPVEDSYWDSIDTRKFYSTIKLPMLHVGGWYDVFIKSTLENYLGFSEGNLDNHSLVVGPWTHGMYARHVGELDFGGEADFMPDKIRQLLFSWFDRWLKDESKLEQKTSKISIFVTGINEWRELEQYPTDTTYRKIYLHSNGKANSLKGDGRLSFEEPGNQQEDRFNYDPLNPVPSVGGNVLPLGLTPGPSDQRKVEERDDVLVYTGDVLEKNTEVNGSITAKLWAVSDVEDTDFTVKLVDVHPNGYAQNIQNGIIRASSRHSLRKKELLKPGEINKFTIDMSVCCHVFKKGHQIRIEVSSSNFPQYDRNQNTIGDERLAGQTKIAHQSIFHNTDYPSHILLPYTEP